MAEEGDDKDKYLPIQNIHKVMRRALPENIKITKEAKEFIRECASEFVLFVTGDAVDICANRKRKNIVGDDVLNSLRHVGFGDYADVLEKYQANYRVWKEKQDLEKGKKKKRKGEDDDDVNLYSE